MKSLLVTGGAGFIGANFIHYWHQQHPDCQIINYDLLTYAGNLANLTAIADDDNYVFIQGDIADAAKVQTLLTKHQPDAIINFAAETHNSRAVLHPAEFVHTNVVGTQVLLEQAHRAEISRLHHISTCEVFGDLALDADVKFTEKSPYRPRTPYNASKASADHLVNAYYQTFALPVTLSYCANNYGPYQHPEKLIPHFITSLLQDEKLTLYQNSQYKREWIHVLDHCRALEKILLAGKIGEAYNIGSEFELDIDAVADHLLAEFALDDSYKTYVPDRPGHDRRYLLDASKLTQELGWQAEIDFEHGLNETIAWYTDNQAWWQPLVAEATVDETAWQQ